MRAVHRCECLQNAATGNQWCAYPDTGCPSGFRWSEANTGDGLGGMCVDGSSGVDAGGCEPLIAWIKNEGTQQLWVTRPDATDQHQVTPISAGVFTWAPSADALAFARSTGEIWTVALDGTSPRPLTTGGQPSWSPDGTRIAFIRNNATIWTIDRDGGVPLQLIDPDPASVASSWSPDSQRIAFHTSRDGNREIYVMLADGTNEVNLTNSPASADTGPQWSPDGSRILFVSDRSGLPDLWIMDADGANPRGLDAVPPSESLLLTYSWFPDGNRILYVRARSGFVADLYVMNADGTGQHPIEEVAEGDVNPAISPDGTQIAWVRGFISGSGALIYSSPTPMAAVRFASRTTPTPTTKPPGGPVPDRHLKWRSGPPAAPTPGSLRGSSGA